LIIFIVILEKENGVQMAQNKYHQAYVNKAEKVVSRGVFAK
jgi:hypothetical protein